MSYDVTLYRILVSAPGDVLDELEIVRDVSTTWNVAHAESLGIGFEVVSWLTHSSAEMGQRPQEILDRQIVADADVLVGIFWTRLGSPTGKAASGTVEEIELHRNAGKPAGLFFSDRPLEPSHVDTAQVTALRQFRKKARTWGLHVSYASLDEFREQFEKFLTRIAREMPARNGVPSEVREYLERWPEFNISTDLAESRVRTSRTSFHTALELILASLAPATTVMSSDSIVGGGDNGIRYWIADGMQFLELTHAAYLRGIQFERTFIARQRDIDDGLPTLVALCRLHNLAGVRTFVASYESLPAECLYEYVVFGTRFVDEAAYDIAGQRIIENWVNWSPRRVASLRERSALSRSFATKLPARWTNAAADFRRVVGAAGDLRQSLLRQGGA